MSTLQCRAYQSRGRKLANVSSEKRLMNSPSPLLNADDRFASAVNFCLVTKVQLYSIVSKGTLPETKKNGILCRQVPLPLLLIVYNTVGDPEPN